VLDECFTLNTAHGNGDGDGEVEWSVGREERVDRYCNQRGTILFDIQEFAASFAVFG
jgi:hypothetical protein